MTLEELRAMLKEKGVAFEEKPIQYGTQVRCKDGEVFSVYKKSGKIVCGGAVTDLTKLVEGHQPGGGVTALPAQPVAQDAIFIVYGHDTQTRDELELLLRRM